MHCITMSRFQITCDRIIARKIPIHLVLFVQIYYKKVEIKHNKIKEFNVNNYYMYRSHVPFERMKLTADFYLIINNGIGRGLIKMKFEV